MWQREDDMGIPGSQQFGASLDFSTHHLVWPYCRFFEPTLATRYMTRASRFMEP